MSTGSIQPFTAITTITVAASTASASTPSGALAGDTVLIYNSTSGVAFVAFGKGSAVATTAGTPIPPGGSRLLYDGPVADTAAVILSTGSGAVYFTAGTGTIY